MKNNAYWAASLLKKQVVYFRAFPRSGSEMQSRQKQQGSSASNLSAPRIFSHAGVERKPVGALRALKYRTPSSTWTGF